MQVLVWYQCSASLSKYQTAQLRNLLFISVWSSIVWLYHNSGILSITDGYLGCLQFLHVMNIAAMNILVLTAGPRISLCFFAKVLFLCCWWCAVHCMYIWWNANQICEFLESWKAACEVFSFFTCKTETCQVLRAGPSTWGALLKCCVLLFPSIFASACFHEEGRYFFLIF